MAQVKRQKVMPVAAPALYATITDFENYPKILTEVKAAKVKPGGSACCKTVVFELEVIKRFSYTLEFKMTPQTEVSWKLIESNFFKTNSGSWKLKTRGAKQTAVEYALEVDFGFFVPGFITKTLTEVNLPKMFDAMEAAAKGK